jgi:Stress responsive A/B Barrel Domain
MRDERDRIASMIRNVVVGRLHPGVEIDAIEPGLAAIVALEVPGLLDCRVGRDLRLREQSWDFAITSDFVDEVAYRNYDTDVEHNRIRREMFAPLCREIARVQFTV